MLSKNQIQILIVVKIFQAMKEKENYILNNLSGQIRAYVSIISNQPTPINDYLPKLLELAEIPFSEEKDDIKFDPNWLKSSGFDISNPQNIYHPEFIHW